jgi:glutaminyl-tRNA synthetase
MAVLDPLKVVLINYPEGQTEQMTAANHPGNAEMGERQIPFGRELWIERGDFMEDPPRKFFRLKPDGEVRLRYGYIIKCEAVIKDADGEITELHCSYDVDSRHGAPGADRKVKGTIHWVAAHASVAAPVRLFDRLFSVPRPDADKSGRDFKEFLNPSSLTTVQAQLEPMLGEAEAGASFQFERSGYFVADSEESRPGAPVFNRVVTLRDSWAKQEKAALQAVDPNAP